MLVTRQLFRYSSASLFSYSVCGWFSFNFLFLLNGRMFWEHELYLSISDGTELVHDQARDKQEQRARLTHGHIGAARIVSTSLPLETSDSIDRVYNDTISTSLSISFTSWPVADWLPHGHFHFGHDDLLSDVLPGNKTSEAATFTLEFTRLFSAYFVCFEAPIIP